MKDVEIIECSKIIAIFHGWIRENEPLHSQFNWLWHGTDNPMLLPHPEDIYSPKGFRYHIQYNWLMPVYCKFRDLPIADLVRRHEHKQIMQPIKYALTHGTIEQLFIELTAAIKWYNNLSQNRNHK